MRATVLVRARWESHGMRQRGLRSGALRREDLDSDPGRVHSRSQARPPSWTQPSSSSGAKLVSATATTSTRGLSRKCSADQADRVVEAHRAGEDHGRETRGPRGHRPADGRVLEEGLVDHVTWSLLAATVNRHGSGAMPRLWSIRTRSANCISYASAHSASRTSWAMPSVRPGQACGPAPNGQPGPRAPRPVPPAIGVEVGKVRGVSGHQVVEAAEEQRADQHHVTGRHALAVELHLAGRDAGRDPRRRGQPQRLPDRMDRVDVSAGWSASQASSHDPGGDRDLDAGSQHGRHLGGRAGRGRGPPPGRPPGRLGRRARPGARGSIAAGAGERR